MNLCACLDRVGRRLLSPSAGLVFYFLDEPRVRGSAPHWVSLSLFLVLCRCRVPQLGVVVVLVSRLAVHSHRLYYRPR